MIISKHCNYEEATRSQTAIRHGIDNTPGIEIIKSMIFVANTLFEPIREWYGKPLIISSFYRCPELNSKVGGAPTSQHCKGEAMDIDTGSREENKKIFEWVKLNLKFDQLLWEYGDEFGPDWVHVSLKKEGNRNQIITIK